MQTFLRFSFVVSALVAFNAQAASSSAGKNEGKRFVQCEEYLKGNEARQMEDELEYKLIGRPFTYMSMLGGRPAARMSLGILAIEDADLSKLIMSVSHSDQLDPDMYEDMNHLAGEVNPLTFQLQSFSNGKLESIFLSTFPDETPSLWFSALLGKNQHKDLDYVAIHNANLRGEIGDDMEVGFSSDPNPKGVRSYVAIHREANGDLIVAEVGVDVPCEHLSTYAYPSDPPRPLVTSGVNYCRVPVVLFGTPEI